MHNITFDFSTLHQHGRAYYDFLGLRKRIFVDTLGWDIPHDDHVEMDQYDTPVAQYSVVLRNGEVIGGARTMPTSAKWGPHGYMLGDAFDGKLGGIPADVVPEAPRSPEVWECTRLVVSDAVICAADRAQCLGLVVDGLASTARKRGAKRLIALTSPALKRTLRQLGWDVSQISEPYQNAHDGRRYAILSMPVTKRVPEPVAELLAA